MRVLLLQDAPHLPTYGGGNKANRLLLEGLARLGHRCEMLSRARNETMAPVTVAELEEALRRRGIAWRRHDGGQLFAYRYRGVSATALDHPDEEARAAAVRRRIAACRPDWMLVSDDRRGFLLDAALAADPQRTVVLVHTLFHLPFGPASRAPDAQRAAALGRARAVLTVSRYAQSYLREHGALASQVVRFPVFGQRSFPPRPTPAPARVAMINPCPAKGLELFLELAHRFAQFPFAAVPTWGANGETLARLAELPNFTLVAPADDLGPFFGTVRVLVAPSQIAETLGYVVIEAMARGIPVLASDLGGLPEAKLGVPYLLPAREREPWVAALGELLADPAREAELARDSRVAAGEFIAGATAERFAAELARLAAE
jgi:glycosyltransferase involved in cell wall biosynthesis